MASIVVAGDTSGTVTLAAPAVSGTTTLTLPTTTGTVLASNSATTLNSGASAMSLQTNATTAVTVDTSQNVGIGTTSPLSKLHVGAGSDSPIIAATTIYASNNGSTSITVRDSTNNVESYIGSYSTGTFVGSASNHPVIFTTNNTERMRIDTNGIITTPYQPAFHANCNGTTQLSGTKLLFQTVATNIGSSYNSSTSTFTAPVAGTYYIYGATMANTGTGRLYWRFAKNGSFFQVSQAGGDSTNYGEWFGSMTVTLAASDSIFMYLDSGTPYGGNSNEQYFGGYLLG